MRANRQAQPAAAAGRRLLLAALLASSTAFSLLAAPAAHAAPSSSERLAAAYAPILQLRAQEDPPCDTSEEQYQPTSVFTMLGNRTVQLLRINKSGTRVIKRAPTAADIAGLDGDYYLNLPEDTLSSDCGYARDFAGLKRSGRAPAVTYARIAREKGHGGFVLQYWFFYYYNQFNDLHEGDWEGMQLAFDANSPADGLAEGPSQIVLFQHAGGEKADWDDDKVEKDGTHPVVYPAAGSHATFYDSAIYVENGQGGSGVGCDNTSKPLRRLAVKPELIPTNPVRGGPDQWLTYEGHWGQKEKGFNNGPTGPITKTVWNQPWSWMSDVRTASPTLPGGALLGPALTGAFCGAVAAASQFINLEAKSRFGALLLALIVIVLIALPIVLTRWRPVDLTELRRPRAFGQLVRAARQLYGRHWRPLVAIGLSAILIVGAVEGIHLLVRALAGSDTLSPSTSGSIKLNINLNFAAIGRPIGFAVVGAAVIAYVYLLERGERAGFFPAYRLVLRRIWRVAFVQLLVNVVLIAMVITIIGIPFAIWKFVGWQFVQQEVIFDDKSFREAFRGSSDVVRGNWGRTLIIAGFFWLISVATGPILGFILIFSNFSLIWTNILGTMVFALLIPFVALGRTLLYLDLSARREQAGAPSPSRIRRWAGRLRPSTQPG